MKASDFIIDCVVNNAIITVLEKYGETSLAAYQEAKDNLCTLEEYAESQCEDFNDDEHPHDPELVYIWNPIKEFLVWEC